MKTHQEKILVADDEASIRRIWETRFPKIGYDVVTAADGEEALETFRSADPDLVLLDVVMPKLDGYSICQELRKESNVPVIMLTALGDAADRKRGLEVGADDYFVKPFSSSELIARIRSLLRRVDRESTSRIPSSGLIHVGNIKIDTNKRLVYKEDELIHLTVREFILLEFLVSYSGEPFKRGEILQEVWGYSSRRLIDIQTVDVHISRLRAKLEDDPSNPELILNTRCGGYLFQRILEPEEE